MKTSTVNFVAGHGYFDVNVWTIAVARSLDDVPRLARRSLKDYLLARMACFQQIGYEMPGLDFRKRQSALRLQDLMKAPLAGRLRRKDALPCSLVASAADQFLAD